MITDCRRVLILVFAAAAGCTQSERQADSSPPVASGSSGCAVGSASTFVGDTALFGVRNECGRWTATPAQLDSLEQFTGFRDSVALAVANCPSAQPIDSLIYGTIGFSDETGDASGAQLIFRRRGAWLSGVSIEGAGGVSAPISLRGLARGPGPAQLTFWVPTAPRTILVHSITLTCNTVEGTYRVRNFADARYDDGASLSEPIPFSMSRSAKAITGFP